MMSAAALLFLVLAQNLNAIEAAPLTPRTSSISKSQFSSLVVFGDSFSDNGNGSYKVSNGTWPPPYYYNGRFSNGPVWCELLASNLSIPFYDYAVGGATTSNALVEGFTGNGSTIPVPSVDEQVSSFIKSPPSAIDMSSTLFVVSGGANDVFFNPNLSALTSASILSSSVTQLQDAGAKNFLFFNYYDIGLIPFSSYTTPFNKAQNAAFSRDLGVALFTLAQSTVGAYYYDLATQLWPHFYFYGEPADYGFDRYGAYGSCATGVYMETGNLSICNDTERRVFWDEYHPTARAHEWFARGVLDVLGVKAS